MLAEDVATAEDIDMLFDQIKAYGLDKVNTLLVGFLDSSSISDANSAAESLRKLAVLWTHLEKRVASKSIDRIGVVDFSARLLEDFIPLVKTPPQVNQINFTFKNCCHLPKHDVIDFCKMHKIELLTHGDDANILPSKVYRSLLRKHDLLKTLPTSSSLTAISELDGEMKLEQESTGQKALFKHNVELKWVCRLTMIEPNRSVVTKKCFIVLAAEIE